jgi:hypothetical protein
MSSTYEGDVASKCNDGLFTDLSICATNGGDRNAWILINAGAQSFSRVIVYNRLQCCKVRIDGSTLTMFKGQTVINPEVSFNSFVHSHQWWRGTTDENERFLCVANSKIAGRSWL